MENQDKNYKKSFIGILIFLLLGLVLVVSANIKLDHFGIFKNDLSKQKMLPNIRYIKVRHILKHPNKYDTYLFGSSKVFYINTKDIPKRNCYNMGIPLLTPYETVKYVKIFVKNKVQIKEIIYAVDNNSFRFGKYPGASIQGLDPVLLYYPDTFVEKVNFFSTYLFNSPIVLDKERDKWQDPYIFDSGSISQAIRHQSGKHLETFETFQQSPFKYNNESLALFSELAKVCKENNIKLTIFISPEYYTNYIHSDIPTYNYYKKKLAQITPYYDFSGLNEKTKDKDYFIDFVHYDCDMADLIIDRIFNQNPNTPPKIKNFGAYVTQENIEAHLQSLCDETDLKKGCLPKE